MSGAPALHVGSVLGERYELVRHIARGGMGDVYEAIDRLLQRRAAVKLYRAASPADRARFDEEVRILASLNHAGLARVYDAGSHGEDAFVVLELIDGPPLSASMGEGRTLPPERVAALGAALADALAYIHSNGVVHRDVTPANILCGPDGRPRVVDFGIVRLLDSPRVTSASITLGTPAYMAPEQVEGQDVTPAADVYSLGLLLLELLTGRHEFVGSVQEVAMARLVRDPDTTTGVPEAWRPFLHRACHRDPAQRPSAEEVRSRLESLGGAAEPTLGDDTVVLPSVTLSGAIPVSDAPLERRPPLWRLAPAWAMGIGMAAALVVVLALTAFAGPDGPRTPATTSTTPTSSGQAPTTIARVRTGALPTTTSTSSPPTTLSSAAPPTTATPPGTSPSTTASPATTVAPPTTSAPPTTGVPVVTP